MDSTMSVFKLDDDEPQAKADLVTRKRQMPNFDLKQTDLRAHYETVVARVLSSVRRDWRLIASLVALALTAACAVIPLMPRQYSATALVYPTLFNGEQTKLTPMGTIDATALVASEARLIVSDAILQAAVKHLELERQPGAVEPRSWVSAAADSIRTMVLPETRNYSPFERQVALLRNRVDVVKDTRSYLISISFTARSAEEAAAVVNTIALEYFRDKKVLRAQNAVAAAEAELVRQLAINGEKHPKVLQSSDGLESARAELKAFTEEGSQNASMTDEGVKLAIPNRTPTSPKGFVILGMSFVMSLLAGIGLAVWRDRHGFEPRGLLADLVSAGSRLGLIGRGTGFASLAQRAIGILCLVGGSIGDRWHRLRGSPARVRDRSRQKTSPSISPLER
jgi:uncharacterized protein involved in exopolysaccharide biosynthesis